MKGAVPPLVRVTGVKGVANTPRVSVVLATATCVCGKPFTVTEAAVALAAALAPPPERVKACEKPPLAPAGTTVIVTGLPLLPAAIDAALVQVTSWPGALHVQPVPLPEVKNWLTGRVVVNVKVPEVDATLAEGVTVKV